MVLYVGDNIVFVVFGVVEVPSIQLLGSSFLALTKCLKWV